MQWRAVTAGAAAFSASRLNKMCDINIYSTKPINKMIELIAFGGKLLFI